MDILVNWIKVVIGQYFDEVNEVLMEVIRQILSDIRLDDVFKVQVIILLSEVDIVQEFGKDIDLDVIQVV